MLAAPLNSTVKELWGGPPNRCCIVPTQKYVDYLKSLEKDDLKALFGETEIDFTKFNNLEKISQVAINNSFFEEEEKILKKFGQVDEVEYEAIKHMYHNYISWRSSSGA